MDAKPFGVARVTHKVSYRNEGHFNISFKVGSTKQVGNIILEMDEESAKEFTPGTEFVLYFEKVTHSDSATT